MKYQGDGKENIGGQCFGRNTVWLPVDLSTKELPTMEEMSSARHLVSEEAISLRKATVPFEKPVVLALPHHHMLGEDHAHSDWTVYS